jgi:hypothetical protein
VADQEAHYEIVREDKQGFDPLGYSYGTREEAEGGLYVSTDHATQRRSSSGGIHATETEPGAASSSR